MNHAGIDFGAKQSGKTVICFLSEGKWQVEQCRKNTDADDFLIRFIESSQIKRIFIDAPLSLPWIFSGSKFSETPDYFYRKADREAKAMSPMFLGGLTARAIRLRDIWQGEGLEIFEAYPAGLVREWQLLDYYKKDLSAFLQELSGNYGMSLPVIENWHQADALLAWLTGFRYGQNQHRTTGDPAEGIIYI